MDYCGQHVIITGGSSGIGRAMARLYVQRGAHVSILAPRQDRLDETLAELAALRTVRSQRLETCSVDVSDLQQVEQAMASLMAGGYPADLLVSAAAIVHLGLKVLDAHKVARWIVRGFEKRRKYVLPGFQTRLFFPVFNGPNLVTGFLRWFYVDRVVDQVCRERERR